MQRISLQTALNSSTGAKAKSAFRRFLLYLLRGPESNRRLEVMSLPRYLSSTPLYIFYFPALFYSTQTAYIYYTPPKKIRNFQKSKSDSRCATREAELLRRTFDTAKKLS